MTLNEKIPKKKHVKIYYFYMRFSEWIYLFSEKLTFITLRFGLKNYQPLFAERYVTSPRSLFKPDDFKCNPNYGSCRKS